MAVTTSNGRAGQGAGDEDTCAGRTDQVQFVGSIGCPVDELLKGRRAQRQVDEPRDRGIWSGKPRCGHDAAILCFD
ncbi:hypothetical protein I552_1580 [Mycobacterium xenopi 3993]|nr:hypothetical protein I552_1580 [Mycobacterium xenopi 3993]